MMEEDHPSGETTGSVVIRDVPVNFPFKPYDCQIVYMEKVYFLLRERQNITYIFNNYSILGDRELARGEDHPIIFQQ